MGTEGAGGTGQSGFSEDGKGTPGACQQPALPHGTEMETETPVCQTGKTGRKAGGHRRRRKTAATAGTITKRAVQAAARHPVFILIIVVLFLLFYILSAFSSLIPMLGSGLANAISGTSYASTDSDLLGADEDYTALENDLKQKIANIEHTHSGYDEYRYNVDEIGHNPYELASYLSAKYHSYTRSGIQGELVEVFEAQYELTLTEEVEIRYRTETSTDADGNETSEEVPYEYYILHVTLKNRTLPAVVNTRLTMEQKEIYSVMQELKGNKLPPVGRHLHGRRHRDGTRLPDTRGGPVRPVLCGPDWGGGEIPGLSYVWGEAPALPPPLTAPASSAGYFPTAASITCPHHGAGHLQPVCPCPPADAKPGDIIFSLAPMTAACQSPTSAFM